MMISFIIAFILIFALGIGLSDAGLGGWFWLAVLAVGYPIILIAAAVWLIAAIVQSAGMSLL